MGSKGNRRRNRKKPKSKMAASYQQRLSELHTRFRLYAWTLIITIVLIVPVVAVIVLQSTPATATHPLESDTTTTDVFHSVLATPMLALGNNAVSDVLPSPPLGSYTEVLVYVGEGGIDWQPMEYGLVPPEREFRFDGHLYYIDQHNLVWLNSNVDVAKLAEADRPFEPLDWRWPETEDVVRFVDEDNRHLRHDLMGTFQDRNRFWFQGVLYEGLAEPDSPSGFAYRPTMLVLNGDGRVLQVEEFAAARGDSLGEAYDSHVSSSAAEGSSSVPPDPRHSLASANPIANTNGSVHRVRDSGDSNVLPTSLGFSGQQRGGVNSAAGVGSSGALQTGLDFSRQQSSGLQIGMESSNGWGLPTDYGFTGQRWDQSIGLYDYHSCFYDPKLGRFISPDPIVPNPGNPQDLNRYAYARNNPLRYTDPDGHTVRSALDLVREYRGNITSIAEQYNLDPVLLAGVVFAENRNDYNWIRGQDWSSAFTLRLFGGPEIKNIVSPLVKDNPSIGITEVSVAVAAMMGNSGLVPDNYADLSWEERSELHTQIAANLSEDERQGILDNLADPQMSLEYTAKYLNFLAGYRDYGDDHALWMSDYNRGLSDWDTTTEYGRRIDVYRENIEHALNWEPTEWICVGGYGCGVAYDRQIYGELP